MASIKKLSTKPSKYLNDFSSSDVNAGNNACIPGAGTTKGTKYLDWPFGGASDGNVRPMEDNSSKINVGLN
jgi:hypothetical protein